LIVLSKTHAWGQNVRARYETSPDAHA
jgi:hypothetical protein